MQEELASREGRKKERKEADRNCEHPRVHFWFLGLDSAFLGLLSPGLHSGFCLSCMEEDSVATKERKRMQDN